MGTRDAHPLNMHQTDSINLPDALRIREIDEAECFKSTFSELFGQRSLWGRFDAVKQTIFCQGIPVTVTASCFCLFFLHVTFLAAHKQRKIIPGWSFINAVSPPPLVPLWIELASRKRLSLMGFCHCFCCLEATTKCGLVGYQLRSSELLISKLQSDAICRWSAPCRHLGHIDSLCPPPGYRQASASVFTHFAVESASQLLLRCSCSSRYWSRQANVMHALSCPRDAPLAVSSQS